MEQIIIHLRNDNRIKYTNKIKFLNEISIYQWKDVKYLIKNNGASGYGYFHFSNWIDLNSKAKSLTKIKLSYD